MVPRDRTFLGTCALLYAVTVAMTVHSCRSMSGGMPMAGGWIMSMAWMRMPGQNWRGAAWSFLSMWALMMTAMMLPSLMPTLQRYRFTLGGPETIQLNALTALAGAGYFFVWGLLGAAVYPAGVLVAQACMRCDVLSRSTPVANSVVLLLAGCLQLTRWKARLLWRCRAAAPCGPALRPDAGSAWNHGLSLGSECVLCCSGLTSILLVTGVMNLNAMVLVTAAITGERLLPQPQRTARAVGFLIIGASLFKIGAELHWYLGV